MLHHIMVWICYLMDLKLEIQMEILMEIGQNLYLHGIAEHPFVSSEGAPVTAR